MMTQSRRFDLHLLQAVARSSGPTERSPSSSIVLCLEFDLKGLKRCLRRVTIGDVIGLAILTPRLLLDLAPRH